ncbi:hypothetical protein CTAYLR_006857 [Chrysophaeum taylorii]|uniref:RING-type domain-containing protein n=1 Tax=Chrysophaeum taylorii TaxID=2483200 RepID=A0AAD7XHL5_9STRA|nr:hypothetical protein CTAYLR_006857 [Chrysophaeum taylorii]
MASQVSRAKTESDENAVASSRSKGGEMEALSTPAIREGGGLSPRREVPEATRLVFATPASEVPTPVRASAPAQTEEMDSGERESLRLALALQCEEEEYMTAQREGAARLAELEAAQVEGPRDEEEEEEEEEEIDESFALAWRLQQEEDDRALFLALNGGRDVPTGTLPRNVSPSQMTFDELTQLGENIGKVSKGTSKSAIDDLPTCVFSEAAAAGAIVGEQCAICRVEFEPDDQLRILPCRHAEHAECIEQWLLLNRMCPLCGKDVAPRADDDDKAASAK